MTKSLLPPNATPTEQRLEQALINSPQLYPKVQPLRQIRTRRPAPLAPYLAAEWQIADKRDFFANDADFFAGGIAWLQRRGTAAAVKRALAMLAIRSVSIENDHFFMHLHLPTPYRGNLSIFYRQVNSSLPLHLQWYRLVAGYDVRHGQYDRSRYDDTLYDDDSGVWVNGVKTSYGEQQSMTVTLRGALFATRHAVTALTVSRRTWSLQRSWEQQPWATAGQYHVTSAGTADNRWQAIAGIDGWKARPWAITAATRGATPTQTWQSMAMWSVAQWSSAPSATVSWSNQTWDTQTWTQ